jgi:hypothetical protein
VQLLQISFTEEDVVYAGRERADRRNDNTEKINTVPKQLYTLGVRPHQVIEGARDQAKFCTAEKYSKYGTVRRCNIEEHRSGSVTKAMEENRYGKR